MSLNPLIIGNWKMNGLQVHLSRIEKLIKNINTLPKNHKINIMICPPATLLYTMAQMTQKTPIKIGGQDCHFNQKGSHTGNISAMMIKNTGSKAVILGHSERRTEHHETDKMVQKKAEAAQSVGLITIICIGETLKEYKTKQTLSVITKKLRLSLPKKGKAKNIVVAYEPIWAIGTGLTPSIQQISEIHTKIRQLLKRRFGSEGEKIKILYGGSVKPNNAQELFNIEHVNGVLVGGASLKIRDFFKIIKMAI